MITIDLSGKIAVVTGATGQLGRTMARVLAEAGADVAVHYSRNAEKAEEIAAEIRSAGRRAIAVQADVTKLQSVLEMRDKIAETLGHPNIVVNSAVAMCKPWKAVLEQSADVYVKLFETCVLHSVNMAKAFLPAMIESNYGRFIGINTECAMLLDPTQSAYSAAKRGMDGVFRVLAREVAEYNITVNEVAPGWTISDTTRDEGEDDAEYTAKVPMKRRGTDREIANTVLFLASDLASYITGVYLPVCGGNVLPRI